MLNHSEEFYKLNPSQLTEHLFIAAARAVTSRSQLELGITCIVNATIELPTMAYQKQETLQIAVEDRIASSLYPYFDLVADKIHEIHESGGKIMVYCRAGQSRSAALCMAYFIKYHKFDFDEAFQYIKARRPIIHPNIGFIRQLKEFIVKCKKVDAMPPLITGPTVNGNTNVIDNSDKNNNNNDNNNVIVNGNGKSNKKKVGQNVKPLFTKEELVQDTVDDEQGTLELEEIELSGFPDLAQVSVQQDLKQVAPRYDAHIIKFNETISIEDHDEDHPNNHINAGGDSFISTHEGLYPVAIMSKVYDICESYTNIPLDSELPLSSTASASAGSTPVRTKSVRKKKKVVISKPKNAANSSETCKDLPASTGKNLAQAVESICPIELSLPIISFDSTLNCDPLEEFKMTGLQKLVIQSKKGFLKYKCKVSYCDTYSAPEVNQNVSWWSAEPLPSSLCYEAVKCVVILPSRCAVIESTNLTSIYIVSQTSSVKDIVQACKAKSGTVEFSACQTSSNCQAAIMGLLLAVASEKTGPGKLQQSLPTGQNTTKTAYQSAYAMRQIKPLNDRIKGLQKFTAKSTSVGGNSKKLPAKDSTGFEKKNVNSKFDLKNLNLGACRLSETYNTLEIVTDTDTGFADDKAPATPPRGIMKNNYKTQKSVKPVKKAISASNKPAPIEVYPQPQYADPPKPHYNWLQVATVTDCPQVLDEDSTLEEIPEEIQNFQYLKFVLANDSNKAKCNIWLDVYKRTLIRMKPTYPTISLCMPPSGIATSAEMIPLQCAAHYHPPQPVEYTPCLQRKISGSLGSAFQPQYQNRYSTGRKISFNGEDRSRRSSYLTPMVQQDATPPVATTSVRVTLVVASSMITTCFYLTQNYKSLEQQLMLVQNYSKILGAPLMHEEPLSQATRCSHESAADGWAKMTLMPTIHKSMDIIEEPFDGGAGSDSGAVGLTSRRNSGAGRSTSKTIYYGRDRNNSSQRLTDLQEIRDKRYRSGSRQSRVSDLRSQVRVSNDLRSVSSDQRPSLKGSRYADESMKRMTSFLDNRLREVTDKKKFEDPDYSSKRLSYPDSIQKDPREEASRRISYQENGNTANSRYSGINGGNSRFESGTSNSSGSRFNSGSHQSRLEASRFESVNPRYDSATSRFSSGSSSASRFESGGSGSRYESGGSGSRFDSGDNSRFGGSNSRYLSGFIKPQNSFRK